MNQRAPPSLAGSGLWSRFRRFSLRDCLPTAAYSTGVAAEPDVSVATHYPDQPPSAIARAVQVASPAGTMA